METVSICSISNWTALAANIYRIQIIKVHKWNNTNLCAVKEKIRLCQFHCKFKDNSFAKVEKIKTNLKFMSNVTVLFSFFQFIFNNFFSVLRNVHSYSDFIEKQRTWCSQKIVQPFVLNIKMLDHELIIGSLQPHYS